MYVALDSDRRSAWRRAAALVLGFIVVILPWCVYASIQRGAFVMIDTMGGAAAGQAYERFGTPRVVSSPALNTIRRLWLALSAAPFDFLNDRLWDFRALFRLVGWQWLEAQSVLPSKAHAMAYKAIAHTSDLMFALSAVLAPLGVVLARRRREALLVTLWAVLHLGLLVAFAWNGVRYRAPYEPVLICLAAAVATGSWARPRRTALAAAALISTVIGATVLMWVSETSAGRASYGFARWTRVEGARRASIAGEGGFSMFAQDRALSFTLAPSAQSPAGETISVDVSVDGRPVDRIRLDGSARDLVYVWPRNIAFVELNATSDLTHAPTSVMVDVATVRH
jgi:hypothetical protein